MAHFTKVKDEIVVQVLVIGNDDIADEKGDEQESLGVALCNQLYGDATWVQTSYNNNFRKNYAGIGDTYDADKDAFYSPKPYPSWSLNDTTCLWEPPVAYPDDDKRYEWDEDNTTWVEIES